jgi:hypothetical protein
MIKYLVAAFLACGALLSISAQAVPTSTASVSTQLSSGDAVQKVSDITGHRRWRYRYRRWGYRGYHRWGYRGHYRRWGYRGYHRTGTVRVYRPGRGR